MDFFKKKMPKLTKRRNEGKQKHDRSRLTDRDKRVFLGSWFKHGMHLLFNIQCHWADKMISQSLCWSFPQKKFIAYLSKINSNLALCVNVW